MAIQINIGYSEFIQMHKNYLSSKGLGPEQIAEQMQRVEKIDSYFKND